MASRRSRSRKWRRDGRAWCCRADLHDRGAELGAWRRSCWSTATGGCFRVPLAKPELLAIETGSPRCNNDHGISPDGRRSLRRIMRGEGSEVY